MKLTNGELEKLSSLLYSNAVKLVEMRIDTLAPADYKEWVDLYEKVKAEMDRQNAEPAEITVPDTFGPKLRECRQAAGLSQKQLAEKVGCTQVDITRWEGGRAPNAVTLKKLAVAIGCSMDDLV